MGFLFKSAIGLGCVYYAMFAQGLRSADLAPTASVCASAAKAGLMGDRTLSAQWAAAGCVAALASDRPSARAATPAPAPVGSLSEADLRDPWFGPGRTLRKAERRG